ncbi:hypothetical protein ACFC1B_06705 [Streptomyces xiamenensis]|uniref:hypothetical protein n=1 Tax=Streptomyces xiamenensis TaxID=408015 RepID=UPI0035E3B7A2
MEHVHHGTPILTEYEIALDLWEGEGGLIAPEIGDEGREWMRISGELGERLPELTDRHDLVVSCETKTRSGAPAAFFPDLAHVEIETGLFYPMLPENIRPTEIGNEDLYPVAWGAFVHEAAHATHTRWRTASDLMGTPAHSAAMLLEESRAERAHLARRPSDRYFIRKMARKVIMADMATAGVSGFGQAAHAAGLVLARRDAEIISREECESVEKAVTKILGLEVLGTLSEIWKAAHMTADDDEAKMMELGRAWCEALPPDDSAPPSMNADCRELSEAIGKSMESISGKGESDSPSPDSHEASASKEDGAAETPPVFAAHGKHGVRPDGERSKRRVVSRVRDPEPEERAAAARLARSLRAASHRERDAATVQSLTPPGRLNMRQALVRVAQERAGSVPTAMPWTRKIKNPPVNPPLRMGIAVDVSGSMGMATGPIASAAWIMARAANLADTTSMTATVAYDENLVSITAPGRVPDRVTEFYAKGIDECLAPAIDALSLGLGLDQPGSAGRILVIASDGHFVDGDEEDAARRRVQNLASLGCSTIWLGFDSDTRPFPECTYVELDDPAEAVSVIGKAALKALAG